MFATDAVIATIMTCARSVYSWDIVVHRVGNKLFLDKRDDSMSTFGICLLLVATHMHTFVLHIFTPLVPRVLHFVTVFTPLVPRVLDFVTVNETAFEPPQEESGSLNSDKELCYEATLINHNFSQQCLKRVSKFSGYEGVRSGIRG